MLSLLQLFLKSLQTSKNISEIIDLIQSVVNHWFNFQAEMQFVVHHLCTRFISGNEKAWKAFLRNDVGTACPADDDDRLNHFHFSTEKAQNSRSCE